MRCIETQKNNMGFEKSIRDITETHTRARARARTHTDTHTHTNTHTHTHTNTDTHIHTHRHTHTHAHTQTNKQTTWNHPKHFFFFSLESCLKILGSQRPSAYLSVVIITHTHIYLPVVLRCKELQNSV
jgi:hypothetical protein